MVNMIMFSSPFTFKIKKYRYSTKIKIEKPERDLAIQRPKARRGDVGMVNKKITFQLNEYKRFYEKLKYYYQQIALQ